MQNPKISVIMPVYNTEEYVEETLISLLNQTMIDDIEVIMIDDGSSDESRHIIERYAFDHDNFHAYHKENEGQGIARNYGLELAKGEYIAFMDSDDYLCPDTYETLYGMAIENGSDIAVGNFLRFALYNIWEDKSFIRSFLGLDEVIKSATFNELPSLVWDAVIWNKLYRRDFLLDNDICFPDRNIFFEDIPFSLKAYVLADSISFTPEITNYWRLRSNQTSVSQQDRNVRNFRNRIEITKMVLDLMEEYNLSDEIRNGLYDKWINHDLKFNLKRIDSYDAQYQQEFISQIHDLVESIPDEVIESQNSYKKVLFKMIKKGDFEALLEFAPLENELYENPHVPSFVGEEYWGDFDFYEDMKGEDLYVYLEDASFDENNLFLEFSETLYYLSDDVEYGIEAELIDGDGKYSLDVNMDDRKVTVPLELIKDKNHLNVKFIYGFEDFKKEALMKNRHRKSISFDEIDIDLDLGVNSYLYIDVRHKCDNEIIISDIAFDGGEFIIKGNSKHHVDEIVMENVVSFERKSYPLDYAGEGPSFSFSIPYDDILNSAVKKWELNCNSCENSISVSQKFFFFIKCHRTRFMNSRNKILVENDIVNPISLMEELSNDNETLKQEKSSLWHEKNELSRQNKELTKRNEELSRKNENLNNTIQEFKSRKVVRIADKIKR